MHRLFQIILSALYAVLLGTALYREQPYNELFIYALLFSYGILGFAYARFYKRKKKYHDSEFFFGMLIGSAFFFFLFEKYYTVLFVFFVPAVLVSLYLALSYWGRDNEWKASAYGIFTALITAAAVYLLGRQYWFAVSMAAFMNGSVSWLVNRRIFNSTRGGF